MPLSLVWPPLAVVSARTASVDDLVDVLDSVAWTLLAAWMDLDRFDP